MLYIWWELDYLIGLIIYIVTLVGAIILFVSFDLVMLDPACLSLFNCSCIFLAIPDLSINHA